MFSWIRKKLHMWSVLTSSNKVPERQKQEHTAIQLLGLRVVGEVFRRHEVRHEVRQESIFGEAFNSEER